MSETKLDFKVAGGNAPVVKFMMPSQTSVVVQSRAFVGSDTSIVGDYYRPNSKRTILETWHKFRGGETALWSYKNIGDKEAELIVGTNSSGSITNLQMNRFPNGIYLRDGAFFAMMNGNLDVTSIKTSQINSNGGRIATLFSQGLSMQWIKPKEEKDCNATLFLESGGSVHLKEVAEGECFKINKKAFFGFSAGAEFNREAAKTSNGKRLPHIMFGEGFSNFVFSGPCSVLYSSRCYIGAEKQKSGTVIGGAVGGGIAGTAVSVKAVLIG